MRRLLFRVVNVFTRGGASFSGNPLCVVEDAVGLDDATLQALARQFNLSETTFLLPSTTADARVRIFTPDYEMPFAGHPTLGTAHVCRALGRGADTLRLEMPVGIVPVEARGSRWTLTAPTATWREAGVSRETLAAGLSLDPQDIGDRPLWLKAGREQLIVPLTSAAAVRRAIPNAAACAAGLPSADGAAMVYVFAHTGPQRTLARFFFPQDGAMLEDPATGSATANFGAWCLALQQPLPLHYEISQGEQVARPSTLFVDVGPDRKVRVSGDVLDIAAGSVTLS